VIASIPANAAMNPFGDGNAASTSTDNTVTYDTTGPVTSNMAVTPSPTNVAPTITATETDSLSNVAGAEYFIDAVGANGSGTAMSAVDGTFDEGAEDVTALMTTTQFNALSDGTHTIYVHGKDQLGTWGATQSITFVKDTAGPTVTINQAVTQSDPTSVAPIKFTVIFSEPVTGFTNNETNLSSSTTGGGGLSSNVYDSGDHMTYEVRVNGMTTAGDVIAKINANTAVDAAGNGNAASSSTDNKVTWQPASGNNTPVVVVDSPAFGTTYAKGTASFTLKAHFTDPDNGPWTYSINWDDGTPNSTGSLTTSGQNFQATHSFPNTGVYTINVCVKDSLGANGCSSVWIVVYDPNGGFITGGGFVNVGAGSYTADPTLSGRANFGFNSQYKKGSTVPTGETEFNFQVGNFNFHSESYNWLVVSGWKAQYKGTGSVNGVSGYNFTLTAYDGDISGGGGVDKFRIVITDGNHGNGVVFDNRNGLPADMDTADPQAIAGGSIVIHKV
jgi:PKD domain